MDFGRLDRLIRIEKPTITRDPNYGSSVTTWNEYATVWASILDQLSNGQEETLQNLRTETRPCKVQARYLPNITADMRVYELERDRYLQIVSVPAEIGRREGIEFICEQYQIDGSV